MFIAKSIFLIVVSMVFCLAQDESTMPIYRKDYVFLPEQNAFYKFHKLKQTWTEALSACKAEGAEFFVPKTKQELSAALNLSENGWIWIAAHDMFSEGDFITTDGKPLSMSYMKWRKGEPNNVNGKENCVAVQPDIEEYLDMNCDDRNYVICKRKNENLTQNSVCETHDPEYIYFSQTDRCYKFHKTPISWHEAYKTCKSEESDLVIINSDTEAKILSSMLYKYPERSLKGNFDKRLILAGFNDLLTRGIFLTTEGETLEAAGYDNWAPREPDNYGGNERCGSMYRDGSLNDITCTARAMFVCEKILSTSEKNPNLSVAKLPDDQ